MNGNRAVVLWDRLFLKAASTYEFFIQITKSTSKIIDGTSASMYPVVSDFFVCSMAIITDLFRKPIPLALLLYCRRLQFLLRVLVTFHNRGVAS